MAKTPPAAPIADRRRLDLLEAAYLLVAEKGLVGLRTRDIVARAGVSIAMLHYYYGTKDALLIAVVEHTATKFIAPQEALGTWPPTLREHLRSARETFDTNPELFVVLQELSLRAQRDPPTRAAFQGLFRSWNALVEEILRNEIAHGRRPADLDPRTGAIVVTSHIMGGMMQLGVDPAAFDFDTVAAEIDRCLR